MRQRRSLYRVRQFLGFARTTITEAERKQIEGVLDPEEQALFWSVSGFSRRHCFNVYSSLLQKGYKERELLAAALLHDVGKRGVGMSHRVAIVLLSSVSPVFLQKLAGQRAHGWRRGLFVGLHHAEQGADLAETSGVPPRVVELIRLHETARSDDPWLAALRSADEAN